MNNKKNTKNEAIREISASITVVTRCPQDVLAWELVICPVIGGFMARELLEDEVLNQVLFQVGRRYRKAPVARLLFFAMESLWDGLASRIDAGNVARISVEAFHGSGETAALAEGWAIRPQGSYAEMALWDDQGELTYRAVDLMPCHDMHALIYQGQRLVTGDVIGEASGFTYTA